MTIRVLVRGGGDLASGILLRVARAGWETIVLEIPKPLAVRRMVSYAQAVYDGSIMIEGIEGRQARDSKDALDLAASGVVAVLVDPEASLINEVQPDVVIDARMLKTEMNDFRNLAPFTIGIGPGFHAGKNCHAVIETRRGPRLGRVYWSGMADLNTGVPDPVGVFQKERVLRAPASGILRSEVKIGDRVLLGQKLASVGGEDVCAPFSGILRGLIQDGVEVMAGVKIGDLDPRDDPLLAYRVSDKALAVGGGVLEAILTQPSLRRKICS